jgi:hypothetical protein
MAGYPLNVECHWRTRMHITPFWSIYLGLLNTVAWAAAIVISVSTIDDLFLDACYWLLEIKGLNERS